MPETEPMALILRGWAIAQQGEFEKGIAEIQAGLEKERATDALLFESYTLGLLADACITNERYGQAFVFLNQAQSRLDEQNCEQFYAAEIYRLLGETYLRSGQDLEQAGRCFCKGLKLRSAFLLTAATAVGLANASPVGGGGGRRTHKMQILRRQSAAVGFSALVLIASLSQADAQARFPCYAKVCVLDKNKFCILALFGPTSFGGRRILVSVQPLPERCGGIQTIGAFSVSLTGSGLGRCGDYLPFACRTTRRLVATAEENGTLAEDAVLARRRLRDGCRCQAAMMSGLDVEADRQVGLPRRYYQLFRVVRGEPWAA
jgi:hypothetical protein